MDQLIEDRWDDRHWDVAMKSDKPLTTYSELKDSIKLSKNEIPLDERPKAEQDWYRST